MKTAAIIAEYNPFHMGHCYHIKKTRELTGADYVIAIMSGDFVQRGEPACTDKYFRTKMALLGGADLVIELPVSYAIASAESFAAGGIALLGELGCVDYLSFGSEWAALSDYEPYVRLFAHEGEAYKSLLKSYLKHGDSYPVARNKAAADLLPDKDPDSFLKEPNHILGLEYLKALSRSGSDIKPLVVIREGAGYHDGRLQKGGFSSAAAIRKACEGLSVQAHGQIDHPWQDENGERSQEKTKTQSQDRPQSMGWSQSHDQTKSQFQDRPQSMCHSQSYDQTASLYSAIGENAQSFLDHILAGETVCWDDLMPLLDYAMLMQDGQYGLDKTDYQGRTDYFKTDQQGRRLFDKTDEQDKAGKISYYTDDNQELLRHIRKHYVAGSRFEDLINTLHIKNRTDTAIKRALLHILLKDAEDLVFHDLSRIPYVRILGFRKTATPLLKEMQRKSAIPLIQRPAKGLAHFSDDHMAASLYRLDIRAATLYEQIAARKSKRPVISELSRKQLII